MIPKLPLSLMCAAALSFACGPRSRADAAPPARDLATAAPAPGSPFAPALRVTVDDEVRFEFHVTNVGRKAAEVSFPDGRTHDVVVLDEAGREVWRWSDGRFFTQAIQQHVVRAGDGLAYDAAWERPAPGRYTAVASLASRDFPVTHRVPFVVPAM